LEDVGRDRVECGPGGRAEVTLYWEPRRHALTGHEVEAARQWIGRCLMAHGGGAERSAIQPLSDHHDEVGR
jgi:hypothetical protein